MGVVKPLKDVSVGVVEGHFLVIACSYDILAEAQSVGHGVVSEDLLVGLVAH